MILNLKYFQMGWIVFIFALAHLMYTPYTKVEESFNMQAMHDILYLRNNVSDYDHNEYPGVVPRTFLGPLFIAIFSSPAIILFNTLGISKIWAQYVVRTVLTGVVCYSWENLRKVIEKKFGSTVSIWYTLITISQFHFIFYMSRPLPNVMALPLVLHAITLWLTNQMHLFIWLSGIAILVFRFELIVFLGLFLASDLTLKKISLEKTLKIAIPAGICILASSIIVDSFFWGHFIWPEGNVLWFNVILNKSSEWGTSPFLWYFYSAIPRSMGFSLLLLPLGFYLERRSRALGVAALTFVFLYSFLPHKELRFIIYVIPVLNISVACACQRIWINREKSLWQQFLMFVACGHLILNFALTIFLLIVSSTNYPGGAALHRLHTLSSNVHNSSVHISNLAAQTGVTRFLEINSDWIYSKKENLNFTDAELHAFEFLLVEAKSKFLPDWPIIVKNYEALEFVDCFSNIGMQYASGFPVKIDTKPCVGIMKRRIKPKISTRIKRDSIFEIHNQEKTEKLQDEIIKVHNESEQQMFKNEVEEISESKDGKVNYGEKITLAEVKIEFPEIIFSEEINDKGKHSGDKLDNKIDKDIVADENTEDVKTQKKILENSVELKEKEMNKNEEIEKNFEIEEIVEKPYKDIKPKKTYTHLKYYSNKKTERTSFRNANDGDDVNKDGILNEINSQPELSHLIISPFLSKDEMDSTGMSGEIEQFNYGQNDDDNEDDGVTVSNENSAEKIKYRFRRRHKISRDINFIELRNLALGKISKSTREKLKEIIEQHYRSKGLKVESDIYDDKEHLENEQTDDTSKTKITVKAIIKQEKIKDIIDKISHMDLTKLCDLNKMDTKECLKRAIDIIDENENS